MIYVKTTTNGLTQETPITALQMFCKCPECGAEVAMNGGELLKLALDFEEGFDFDSSSIYCDSCTMERARIREQLHNVQTAIDKMPLREAAQLVESLKPYCHEQA